MITSSKDSQVLILQFSKTFFIILKIEKRRQKYYEPPAPLLLVQTNNKCCCLGGAHGCRATIFSDKINERFRDFNRTE